MKHLGIALSALVAMTTNAKATPAERPDQVCFADSEGVRRHSPGAYPSWTFRMNGHKHEKCWFPAVDKFHKRWSPIQADNMPTKAKEVSNRTASKPKKANSHEITNRAILETPSVPEYYDHTDNFSERFEAVYTVDISKFNTWAQSLF